VCKKPSPGHCILRARWSEEYVEERIEALFAWISQHIDEIEMKEIWRRGYRETWIRESDEAEACTPDWALSKRILVSASII
jgi:hypothetical protein